MTNDNQNNKQTIFSVTSNVDNLDTINVQLKGNPNDLIDLALNGIISVLEDSDSFDSIDRITQNFIEWATESKREFELKKEMESKIEENKDNESEDN